MRVRRTCRHAARALIDRAHAEADQQEDDAHLEHSRCDRGHFSLHHHQQRAGCEQCQRMAQSPPRAEPRGLRAAPFAGHESRDGSQMIGLERVPHTEQRAEAGARSKSQWKCGVVRSVRRRRESVFGPRPQARLLKHPIHDERSRETNEHPADIGRA